MANDIEAARAEFEAWAEFRWHPDVGRWPSAKDQDEVGGYFNTAVEYAWRAWKASRAALAAPASGAVEERPQGEADEARKYLAQMRTEAAERAERGGKGA